MEKSKEKGGVNVLLLEFILVVLTAMIVLIKVLILPGLIPEKTNSISNALIVVSIGLIIYQPISCHYLAGATLIGIILGYNAVKAINSTVYPTMYRQGTLNGNE